MNNDEHTSAQALGLEAMRRFDVKKGNNTSDLLRELAGTAFTGRSLGEAADVAEAMIEQDCFVVLTLSGAMTMAGLSLLVIEMVERGWVDCIVSTGALVGHGLTEDLGLRHYKADRSVSDAQYWDLRLNRIYDVIEPESNLDHLAERVRLLLAEMAASVTHAVGTYDILRFFGEKLGGIGVLQSAAKADVPIYIPAFSDSELGLDFVVASEHQRDRGETPLQYDAFRDLMHYAQLCSERTAAGRKSGIFTIGGGVPRNWAQQVAPFVDAYNQRLGQSWSVPRFSYGVRICPDPVHYGHLSGCTYSEGVSWGKFVPPAQGGRYAEVLMDATVAWPLIVRALIERSL